MKKLTTVVIGLGGQSLSDHIPALLRRNDVEIVGVCDPSPAARKAFKNTFPELKNVTIADSIDPLLEEVRPEAAVVAVPHDSYFDIVVKLCERHIYFLKEKPLARDLEEARAMLSIANFKDYGFITTQRRYSKLYQRAKESIAELGSPYLFHAVYKLNIDAPDDGWRGSKSSAGGGCLIDMGYHLVDQLIWWFGMPQKVHAQISSLAVPDSDYDAEDSATISFRYASGLHGTLLISRAAGEKHEEYELYGSKGYLVGSKKKFTAHDRQGKILDEMSQDNSADMLDDQLAFFISRVRAQKGFADIQQEHLANMEFIDRCYKDAADESYITTTNVTEEFAYVSA
ncbi:MAG TPA: Gfo/Idh/MocA family oxidoreductase [Candidatus Saccharimonadia bacterium]|nr:Gfo/Idh/MocA family oxidoreductase [Candidatus Saccharimonadia bacterium]